VSSYLKKSDVISINRLSGLIAIIIVCALFLMADIAISTEANSPAGNKLTGANDVNGPSVKLNYNIESPEKNPSVSFMYFVPLIAPTTVDIETDVNNKQMARIISYEKNITSKSFYVSCEFEMEGDGFFKTVFNPEQVINIINQDGQKPNEPMTNALDYIEFQGDGLGRMEIRGTISGTKETVTEIDAHFNVRGHKSPVTIGLYDIKPINGQFKYENKYNEKIARIATLTFKKTDGDPKMGIKVISVNKASKPDSYIGKVKATIANFFLNPPTVSRIGNDTMLNFGLALMKKQTSFTFPKATNLREFRKVAEDNVSKQQSVPGKK
jgi:hypothetical protein